MIGLRAFNLVLVGKGFPVDQVNADDFSFNGSIPNTTMKLPQLLQAATDEYTLQLLPDRLQVQAAASKATQYRIQAIISNAKKFVEDFASKRSITAIGHNFIGTFASPIGDAAAFMEFLAWPDGINEVLSPLTQPTISWSARYKLAEDTLCLVRLEPSSDDPSRVFYDLNLTWGNPEARTPVPDVFELLERFPRSSDEASVIVDGLAAFGSRGG